MVSVACFLQGKNDEEVRIFSKMAADRGISLSCFFEVEVILESKMARIRMTIDINWNQKWKMTVILTFSNHSRTRC